MIMANILTSKGIFEYKSHLLYFGNHTINKDRMTYFIQIIALILDKIDINWGPAFGTLIGIVRNNDYLPWNPCFDIYILKELIWFVMRGEGCIILSIMESMSKCLSLGRYPQT